MRGFAEKAVIIFPRPEFVESKHVSYMERFRSSLNNVVKYLKYKGIQPYALSTDEMAQKIKHTEILFIANVSKGDSFFIKNNCVGFNNMSEGTDEFYSSIIADTNDSLKVTPGLSPEERFKILQKREAKINKYILSREKVIVNFSPARNATFKIPESKENDSRMILTANPVSNYLEIELGGVVINPVDILGFNGATLPLHLWKDADWFEQ